MSLEKKTQGLTSSVINPHQVMQPDFDLRATKMTYGSQPLRNGVHTLRQRVHGCFPSHLPGHHRLLAWAELWVMGSILAEPCVTLAE